MPEITPVWIPCVLAEGTDKVYPFPYCLDPEPTELLAWESAAHHLNGNTDLYIESGSHDPSEALPAIEVFRGYFSASRFPDRLKLALPDEQWTVVVCQKQWPGQWPEVPEDDGMTPWRPAPYKMPPAPEPDRLLAAEDE